MHHEKEIASGHPRSGGTGHVGRGRGAYAGRERADPAAAAAMVHLALLEGAPCSVPGHRWSSWPVARSGPALGLSLIHISEPTRLGMISYAVFCLKKKKKKK